MRIFAREMDERLLDPKPEFSAALVGGGLENLGQVRARSLAIDAAGGRLRQDKHGMLLAVARERELKILRLDAQVHARAVDGKELGDELELVRAEAGDERALGSERAIVMRFAQAFGGHHRAAGKINAQLAEVGISNAIDTHRRY